MSSTLRLFLNDKRISTAVKTKAGSLLQVYPEKKEFTDEVQWQAYWDLQMKPKIILRIGEPSASPKKTDSERFAQMEERGRVAAAQSIALAKLYPPLSPAPKSKKTYPASEVIFNTLAQLPPKPAETKASLDNWNVNKQQNFSFTLPAGTYYIGDLCYALSKNIYDNVFGGTGYESGIYEEKGSDRVFAVGSTAWGDGEFEGTDGRVFAVDSGTIGICSKSLVEKSGKGGHLYTFASPVKCHFKMGWFTFFWDYYNALDIKTDQV